MLQRLRLAIVIVSLAATGVTGQSGQRFRVISYNVLVGFGNYAVGDPYLPGAERKANILSWLSDQAPDVVALQEMNGYDEAKLRADSASWGHPYAVMLKKGGYPTALTSKHPIRVVARRIEGLHHGMMVCRTAGIDFIVVHLWPFKGEQRLREINAALAFYDASRASARPVVMLGDFNAVSPDDVDRFSETARQRYAKWKWETRNGRPDTSVMQAAFDKGLVDIHAKHRAAAGELPLPRIDFILASPELAQRSSASRWITAADALKNSDHPAVVADFEVKVPRFAGYPAQDMLEYGLALEVDPAARRMKGTVNYRIRAEATLDRVFLDARRGEDWTISFTDEDGPIDVRWHGDRVVVPLREPVVAGAIVTLEASLVGVPPDGFYFKNSRHGDPLAFTDHYSIRARGWLPCEDHPGDRAKFTLLLSYPEGNDAVASGRELVKERRGRKRWFETQSDLPPYMFAICVGPYARVKEVGDDRIIPHFVYRQDVEKARRSLVHHALWIKTMEDAFGSYPYGKYTTIQCPTRWGGFEAPGNVQLSERLFDGRGGGVGTLAHELVHMWFGDGVGYAEWREVLLSEGFASYFGPWLHERSGGPKLADSMQRMRDRWRRSADGRMKSVRWDGFAHPDRALNANTYPKGAWILHMLRGELGDQRFFKAIREWFIAASGTSVLTSDFVRSVEASSGRKLGWFFDQWLDRVGCPILEVEANADAIVVKQTQKVPYRFRLSLAWTGTDGQRTKRVFAINGAKTTLDVKGAKDVVIDPDVELLFRVAR